MGVMEGVMSKLSMEIPVVLNLGSGLTGKPGEILTDLSEAATSIFKLNTLDFLKGIRSNSVDKVVSIHSLEHLSSKTEFVEVMREILRVTKTGATLYFEFPYWSQSVNAANPYHNFILNEHTFRFFCTQKEDRRGVLEKDAWIQGHSFGLIGSANEVNLLKQ